MNRLLQSGFAIIMGICLLLGFLSGCSSNPSLKESSVVECNAVESGIVARGVTAASNDDIETDWNVVLKPFDSVPLKYSGEADGETINWDKILSVPQSVASGSGEIVERGGSYSLGCNLALPPDSVSNCLAAKVNTFRKKARGDILRIQIHDKKIRRKALTYAKKSANTKLTQVRQQRTQANARMVRYQRELNRLQILLISKGRKPTGFSRIRLRGENDIPEEFDWDSIIRPYQEVIASHEADESQVTELALFPNIDVNGCNFAQNSASVKECVNNKVRDYRDGVDLQVRSPRNQVRRTLDAKLAEARKAAIAALTRARSDLRTTNALVTEYKTQIKQLRRQLSGS